MRVEGINNIDKELDFPLYNQKGDTDFLSILFQAIESVDTTKGEKISNHDAVLLTSAFTATQNVPYLFIPNMILNPSEDPENISSDAYIDGMQEPQISNNSFAEAPLLQSANNNLTNKLDSKTNGKSLSQVMQNEKVYAFNTEELNMDEFESKKSQSEADLKARAVLTLTESLEYTKPSVASYEDLNSSLNNKVTVASFGGLKDSSKLLDSPPTYQTHTVKNHRAPDEFLNEKPDYAHYSVSQESSEPLKIKELSPKDPYTTQQAMSRFFNNETPEGLQHSTKPQNHQTHTAKNNRALDEFLNEKPNYTHYSVSQESSELLKIKELSLKDPYTTQQAMNRSFNYGTLESTQLSKNLQNETHTVKDDRAIDDMADKNLSENSNGSDKDYRRILTIADKKALAEENNTTQLSNNKQVMEGSDLKQAKKSDEELPKEVSYNIEQREKLLENKVINQVEPRSKQYQMVEHKYVRVHLDETDINIRVVRDSIKVGVDLKSDIGYIFRGEINKLVESLNNIGFRLEALQVNGSLLYSDSRPEDRKEERNKHTQYQKGKSNNSQERFELSI